MDSTVTILMFNVKVVELTKIVRLLFLMQQILVQLEYIIFSKII